PRTAWARLVARHPAPRRRVLRVYRCAVRSPDPGRGSGGLLYRPLGIAAGRRQNQHRLRERPLSHALSPNKIRRPPVAELDHLAEKDLSHWPVLLAIPR